MKFRRGWGNQYLRGKFPVYLKPKKKQPADYIMTYVHFVTSYRSSWVEKSSRWKMCRNSKHIHYV